MKNELISGINIQDKAIETDVYGLKETTVLTFRQQVGNYPGITAEKRRYLPTFQGF